MCSGGMSSVRARGVFIVGKKKTKSFEQRKPIARHANRLLPIRIGIYKKMKYLVSAHVRLEAEGQERNGKNEQPD
jgi:hypothetical protein